MFLPIRKNSNAPTTNAKSSHSADWRTFEDILTRITPLLEKSISADTLAVRGAMLKQVVRAAALG